MKLKWKKVDSSCIDQIAYLRKEKKLVVQFLHGGVYTYEGIGYIRWRNLRDAESVGKYYNEAIKVKKAA